MPSLHLIKNKRLDKEQWYLLAPLTPLHLRFIISYGYQSIWVISYILGFSPGDFCISFFLHCLYLGLLVWYKCIDCMNELTTYETFVWAEVMRDVTVSSLGDFVSLLVPSPTTT